MASMSISHMTGFRMNHTSVIIKYCQPQKSFKKSVHLSTDDERDEVPWERSEEKDASSYVQDTLACEHSPPDPPDFRDVPPLERFIDKEETNTEALGGCVSP